jgi:hypothetical protein
MRAVPRRRPDGHALGDIVHRTFEVFGKLVEQLVQGYEIRS